MDNNYSRHKRIEIWGGPECTINRVRSTAYDQLEMSGHYLRKKDIKLFTGLGIKAIRYPVLWEKHQPKKSMQPFFGEHSDRLRSLHENNVELIAGLLHHGSGPFYTDLLDGNFPSLFASYAGKVAKEFPFIKKFIPVNEPLTTARFSGLYGIWYPHHKNDVSFFSMLLNQLKASVLAMKEIRKYTPDAVFIQTEDLAKIFSSPALKYQADFENQRRWLTYDILFGKLNSRHPLYDYLIRSGIRPEQLDFFLEENCTPDILGANYYVTSERYLDESIDEYPYKLPGGNDRDFYSDIEAARVSGLQDKGLKHRLQELWQRYKTTIALTEVHLDCFREEQMRWLYQAWTVCNSLKDQGVDINAITVWSLLGSFGWDKLLASDSFRYESGVFELTSGRPRRTALTRMIKHLSRYQKYDHPLLSSKGWWERLESSAKEITFDPGLIFIIGKRGTLAKTIAKRCDERAINYLQLGRNEFDLSDPEMMHNMIKMYQPWAIVNCAGYADIDSAESNIEKCLELNMRGVIYLSAECKRRNIKLLCYSSDQIFNGEKKTAYIEKDKPDPLNVYGISKMLAERVIARLNPDTLIIRTSAFFCADDESNYLNVALKNLMADKIITIASDVTFTPAYLPHVADKSLDLLADNEKGIFHLTNRGSVSWAELILMVAEFAGVGRKNIHKKKFSEFNLSAKRPANSSLISTKGNVLPFTEDAVMEYVREYFSANKLRIINSN